MVGKWRLVIANNERCRQFVVLTNNISNTCMYIRLFQRTPKRIEKEKAIREKKQKQANP